MIDKLEEISNRFEEVSKLIVLPETMADMKNYAKLNKEYKDLEKVVSLYKKFKEVLGNIDNAKSIIATEKDPEFREMAKEELDEFNSEKKALEEKLKTLLIPKDPK
eukprot:TRINITY_DN40644_c0_g1_i1.p3 TRINITY_DN40644_c0_g1~~TRINITY_DN40644_c0_g1_i1.p3  ORF type:complete len:106 (-),score=20.70 TRINITY_DN40644_c0_g1_i1:56-373(-)